MSNETRFEVVGLGNAIVDILAPAAEEFLNEWDIRKNGMTLIDEDRATKLTEQANGAIITSGGSGANTIAGIASFGGNAAYIGKVAEDDLGRQFQDEMQNSGVPFATKPLMDGPKTARCIIFVTDDGARSMNTFLGASVMFCVDDVDKHTIEQGDILYLEGYLFDRDEAKKAFIHAAEIATAAGRRVALTLSDSFCVDRHRDSFLHLLKNHIDILLANEAELLSLYETDDFDAAIERLRADTHTAAVTRSEKGSVVMNGEGVFAVPAEPIDRVIDTTGAGDQYAAGFLIGQARNMPLETCAKLGHIAAAEVISHYGPRPEIALAELVQKAGITL